jgi:8-oxo-dGTP diphosphatase
MSIKNLAKAVILNREGQVLLLRRSKTDTRCPGEWGFPGGNVEADENFTDGVIREIHEEAGLDVPLESLVLVYTATEEYTEGDMSINRLLFAAQLAHPFYGGGLRYARDHGLLEPL